MIMIVCKNVSDEFVQGVNEISKKIGDLLIISDSITNEELNTEAKKNNAICMVIIEKGDNKIYASEKNSESQNLRDKIANALKSAGQTITKSYLEDLLQFYAPTVLLQVEKIESSAIAKGIADWAGMELRKDEEIII